MKFLSAIPRSSSCTKAGVKRVSNTVRGRELYGSVGREPTLRLDGDVLGREAGASNVGIREAVTFPCDPPRAAGDLVLVKTEGP
jgi:hypothetical protein